ncbi:MAG: hypothetical protein IPK31_22345 [Chitinophagaceae bacterium]|nr:hypothetical protein [Chitinophagaceae bacterium]
MQQINYIPHSEIDKTKWDNCIDHSVNGLIYSYSWYLDAMADQWDALVLNDYEAVMPLTWNKKYGIHYLFQPYFCASLGVFAKKNIDKEMLEAFLIAIPAKFKYFDIYLNQQNLFSVDDYPLTERINFVLPLDKDYETISSAYRSNLKRNIKKAETGGLIIKEGIELNEIISLAKETMQRISSITDEQISRFFKSSYRSRKKQKVETLGIYSKAGELLASAVFLYSHQRWYYILVGNHPNGKTLGASH